MPICHDTAFSSKKFEYFSYASYNAPRFLRYWKIFWVWLSFIFLMQIGFYDVARSFGYVAGCRAVPKSSSVDVKHF